MTPISLYLSIHLIDQASQIWSTPLWPIFHGPKLPNLPHSGVDLAPHTDCILYGQNFKTHFEIHICAAQFRFWWFVILAFFIMIWLFLMKPEFFLASAELAWPNDSFEPPHEFLKGVDHTKKVKWKIFWNCLYFCLFVYFDS